jgi:hypothetical protein
MSRQSFSSGDEDTLLGSKGENLPLPSREKRRTNLTLIHFSLVVLLSSVVSIVASLIVWRAVQPKSGPGESIHLLPGLDIPPRTKTSVYVFFLN